MRLVLTGGGTGGHIYPALAIARYCREQNPDTEILYIGSEKGLEKEIVTREGLNFVAIEISGFRRKISLENFRTVWRFLTAVRRCKQLLKQFKPDAVVGTGGYVCGPVVYAASRLNVPSLIHEQNVIPGLTNVFLSRYVHTVAVSFEGSEKHFTAAKRTRYTGNPRATEVVSADSAKGRASFSIREGVPFVVVFGGSRGARAVNEAMVELCGMLQEPLPYDIVYITGQVYFAEIRQRLDGLGQGAASVHVVPYVDNMPEVLAAAALVVGRSGASSLAEITALGLPSILVPSPNVTNDHQAANARWLADEQAAIMILESELSGKALLEKMNAIMDDPVRREHMAVQSKKLGQPDAAGRLYEELLALNEKTSI